MAVRFELQGIVAKHAGSIYHARRSTRWQKIRTTIRWKHERAAAR